MSAIHLTVYTDAQDFLSRTQDSLLEKEAANNLILGISFGLSRNVIQPISAPFLATVEDEQGLIIAACMTPPYRLILYSHRPLGHQGALAALLEHLQTQHIHVSGCIGPVQVTEDFSRLWQDKTNQTVKIMTRERVFELTQVIPPRATSGTLRQATAKDAELMLHWWKAFFEEAMHNEQMNEVERTVQSKLSRGDIFVWETTPNHYVSMVAKSRAIVNVINIGPVYTPPGERGKGYASNCVAALSQHLLDNGWKACSLFTDLANPTSNSIYQKIGYRPLEDVNEISFE